MSILLVCLVRYSPDSYRDAPQGQFYAKIGQFSFTTSKIKYYLVIIFKVKQISYLCTG